MKIKKILIPTLTVAPLATAIMPLALTSCGTQVLGNLMTEYTPNIGQHETISKQMPSSVVDAYFDAIVDEPEIFAQDFIYTLSRGLPQYVSYVSEFCEISGQNYDIRVYDVVPNMNDLTITFKADFYMYYDYSKTKVEELRWYDLGYKVWDATTTVEMTLDFDTTAAAGFNADVDTRIQRKQMTTYAGATQLGISERGSTIKVLKEKGYCIDLDDNRIEMTQTTPSKADHFMIPSYNYWYSIGQTDTYTEHMNEVYDVWYQMPGAQIIILLLKYYLPSNALDLPNIPASMDFGSYHMANATLDDTYRSLVGPDGRNVLYGFNKSLDSIRNYEHIKDKLGDEGVLILPSDCITIGANAFDGNVVPYTNIGIPDGVKKVVIPNTYQEINQSAFALNPMVGGFESLQLNPFAGSDWLSIKPYAFDQLLSLRQIDLNNFPANYAQLAYDAGEDDIWENAFASVHLGADFGGDEGEIILPNDCSPSEVTAWENFLIKAGFSKVYVPDEFEHEGWKLIVPTNP